MNVNKISEVRTAPALTTADSPPGVRIRPYTIHGWRPDFGGEPAKLIAIAGRARRKPAATAANAVLQ